MSNPLAWCFGIHGPGMHDWILDEAMLGKRVAHSLDDENNCWGATEMYWWLTRDWDEELGFSGPIEMEEL